MANEPSWDDIFRPSGQEPASPDAADAPRPSRTPVGSRMAAESSATATMSRRELREAESRRGADGGRGRGDRRRRRLGWLWALLVVLALGAGAAAAVWTLFEDQVREVMGWELPNDFEGAGNGTEVDVTIVAGDIGSDVATTLAETGVTMTFEAFYELLLAQDEEVVFTPGTYRLQEEMSAQAALDALLDEENRIVNSVAVREGVTIPTIVELLAAGTGIPAADFEAALVDPASYGIPAEAVNFEGYLFPATYRFEPGLDARGIVQTMVDRMFQSLDAAGVAPEDRHRVVTIASLIQREARIAEDFFKVSRVIQNRLAEDWKLEFDSTAQYGYQENHGSVWSSDEQLTDVNDYNTYVITGLPIGPIAAPGDLAIEAALDPAEGSWMFFATVDLDTGETVFSTTLAEHEEAVAQLRAWCRENEC